MTTATMIDRAALTCTCCGVKGQPCDCWDGRTDSCEAPDGFGCAEHCKCPRCVMVRREGVYRVDIRTGTRHFAPAAAHGPGGRTLCGRTIPPPWPWARPAKPALLARPDDCRRCAAKAEAMGFIEPSSLA
jgi:hypothetical protein